MPEAIPPSPRLPNADSMVVRVLSWLTDAVVRHPHWFIWPQLVLFVVCLLYTVDKLQFDMDRNNLLGSDQKYHQNFLRYEREFQAGQDVVTVVESDSVEKNRQFVERLGRRMENEPQWFTNVFYKGDLKLMGSKALLLETNEAQLAEMLQRLGEARPMIRNFTQVTNLDSLFGMVKRQFLHASGELDTNTEATLKALPVLTRILNSAADAVRRPGTPPSPGVTALFDSGEEAEASLYITFATNRIYVVTAQPAHPDSVEATVRRLRALVHETLVEVPGVNVGITGGPVLEVDETAQSKRDATFATVISLILCAGLFIYAYSEVWRPLKAVVSLVIGLGYTLGFATLVVGHLNLLTVTFLPILIGLAIDFGVHLVTRYEEELRRGRTEPEAMRKAIVFTGQGIFTGCFTTAGAFLAMWLTNFRGIQEMGLISGGGLLICLVPMMTLFPVLLLRARRQTTDAEAPTLAERRARIERLWLDRPGLVTAITLTVTVLALTQFPKVYFDYNLLNLQTKGLPAVEYERQLIDAAGRSVLFGAVVADSPQKAAALERKLTTLPSVASVDSMARYLTEDQTRKLALIRQIKEQLVDIHFAPVDMRPVELRDLRLTLQYLQTYLTMGGSAAGKAGERELAQQLTNVHDAIGRLRDAMHNGDPAVVAHKLSLFQQALFNDLHDTLAAIAGQDASAPLRAQDLPPTLRNRFIGKSGTNFLLQVNPKHDVWERKNQEEFVRELRSVDPDVTGEPVQLLEYTSLLKDSYIQAAWYALGAIALLVLVHFRSLPCLIMALLPVLLGATWLVGWMGFAGVPFNPANIMTLPLVIGIGVTNGIHILNRFAEEQRPSILAKSTGKAVLVSALATMAGFGSLIPGKHQGMSSLGLVMASGACACMVAGLLFLPTLLGWLAQRGWTMPNKKPRGDHAQPPLGSGGTEAKPLG
ncbi:MAG: MMPL family transporter [Verrucomicrobiota bacterium]